MKIVVTGATGLIGGAIALEATRQGMTVLALLRRAERVEGMRRDFDRRGGDGSKLVAVEADLDRPSLGLRDVACLADARVIVHAGGRIAWDMDRAGGVRTHRDGTLELLLLTRHMRHLERFVAISGFQAPRVVARHYHGRAATPRDDLYHRYGVYEASKIEGYVATRDAAAAQGIPLTVVHPAGLIGDSQSGETSQLTGLGEVMQLIAERRLLAKPGSPDAWLPLVTADHLARLTLGLAFLDDAEGREYVAFDPDSPSLREVIAMASRRYHGEDGAVPQLSLPLSLVRRMPRSLRRVSREAIDFIEEERYGAPETRAAERALGLTPPNIRAALARWMDYLKERDFLAA